MRPWMKMFAFGGIVGVSLSLCVAADQPTDRRIGGATKKPSKLGQLQFFGRHNSAASDKKDTPQEQPAVTTDSPSDASAGLPINTEIESLKADVNAVPKRYTRQKAAVVADLKQATSKPVRRNLEAEIFGDDEPSTAKVTIPTTKRSAQTSKPEKLLTETGSVELLAPPVTESTAAEPTNASPAVKRPTTRKSKLTATELLQASLNDRGESEAASEVAEPSAAESSTSGSIELTSAAEDNGTESKEGVIGANFNQAVGTKSAIKQVRAEQKAVLPLTRVKEPEALNPATQTTRLSVASDKPMKSGLPTSSRSARPVSMSSRMSAPSQSGTPSVSVEWVKRSEINVGQECLCDLVVKNSGKVSAREVVVDAFFPTTVRLTHAEPAPSQAADHLEWSIAELAAGEEQVIHIKMIPSQRGDLATTANVRFTGTAASVFKVEEPLLKVSLQSPAEVSVGDPFVQTVTVTNPGTGVAQNVKIQVKTTAGLESVRAEGAGMEIGSLSPGETRTIRLSFNATAGGNQMLGVVAVADSGLKQAAESRVNVIAAALNVGIEGPALRYVGRDARYTVTVKNEGKAATNNVRVVHRIPNGFKYVKADKGGTFDANSGAVTWFVGHLEADQVAQLKLQLQATELGHFEHQVTVTSEHGLVAKAGSVTNVEGSAALAMEIQDLEDPVEVGQETAYEIRISNTGSKAAEKVGLTFELPSGLELIKVQSATEHLSKNGLILFNDLAELAPGKTAIYRVHVRGKSEGSQRVRARLTSDSIDQELISEEITKFYAE